MKLHTAIRGTLLIAAAASGLVWFVAWGAIHGWFPSLQRTLLLELANREGPYAVEVRAVGGSLVEGFVLEGLSLHAREDDGEQATASPIEVERARVELDLSHAYEQRHVIVRHLALEGVALRLEQTEAGGWQLQDLPLPSDPAARTETEPGTQAWRVSVDELLVREAEVSGRFGESGSLVARGTLVASDLAWPIPQERGPWSTLALDLRSLEGEFAAVRLRSGRLRVAGSPEHLDVHLEQASASAGERGQFHASGRASVDTTHDNPVIDDVEGLLAFSALDLAGLSSPLEGTTLPSTRLNGEIQLDQEEDWRVDFTLDASQIDSVAIKSARGHFDYTPETKAWRLTATQIDAEGSTVTARGHGTFDQIESLEIDAFDLPVAPFAAALGTSSHTVGNFDLVARLSGPPSDPRGRLVVEAGVELDARPPLDIGLELELEGQGHYTLGRIDLASDEPADFDLASTAPAKLVRENGTWHLRNLDLAGRHGGIEITRLRSDGTHHEIEAEFDQLDLAAVTRTFTPDSVIEGRLRGPLRFDSYGPHMTLTSELAFEAPRYGEFAVDRVVVSSASNERLWSFDARVEWGQALPIEINAVVPYAVATDGAVALAAHPETRIAVRVDQIETRQLESLLAGYAEVEGLFEGSLTGRFQMQGSSQGPQISGDARWHGARFGTAVADDVALTCRTEEGILHVDLGISHEGLSGFVADAQIDLERWVAQPDGLLRDPHHRASLRAEDVDLGWLIPSASARRLGRIEAVLGRATGEVDIRGSEDGPRINGRLRIRKGEIRLGLVDEPIGPIQAALLFDNDELRVERIRIGSRKGAAFVRGRYRWASGNTPDEVDLNAHFKKFALTHFPLLDAQVDGNVDLTGSLSTLNAQGDLALSRVQISLPAPEDPLFREVRILGLEGNDALATEGPAPREPSAYETMRAQIALDVRPGAKIRERGANLEAEGQVLLRKKRLSPTVLQGSLQTTGGTYTFLGRTFDVEKGVVTFEERLPPDPELRIVATRHIGDVTVSVRRTGTWSNPSSRLTSEPEMDETEILSYLVFNKPRKEITAEDDAQLNAAAAQLAGNLALAELSRLLASDLPISEISMEMGEDMTLTSVGVETNVGEDIILRYDRALQDGMGDRFTVEWRFWKDFSLRSEYADGGTSGLDLFWSYEY